MQPLMDIYGIVLVLILTDLRKIRKIDRCVCNRYDPCGTPLAAKIHFQILKMANDV